VEYYEYIAFELTNVILIVVAYIKLSSGSQPISIEHRFLIGNLLLISTLGFIYIDFIFYSLRFDWIPVRFVFFGN